MNDENGAASAAIILLVFFFYVLPSIFVVSGYLDLFCNRKLSTWWCGRSYFTVLVGIAAIGLGWPVWGPIYVLVLSIQWLRKPYKG